MKPMIAALLLLLWLPATLLCRLESSGLITKGDCCTEESSPPVSASGHCHEPCGILASATYLLQHVPLDAPEFVGEAVTVTACPLVAIRPAHVTGRDAPGTAPPEFAGHWQFHSRTALPPRAPSFAS